LSLKGSSEPAEGCNFSYRAVLFFDYSARDSSGMVHGLNLIAFVIHIAGGSVGLISGTMAAFARKGGNLHRKAGTVFVVSMTAMALFAIYLGFAMPGQLTNVIIGCFSLYLVTTAWMAARRRETASRLPERLAFVISLLLLAPFAILSIQLAVGLPPLFVSALPFRGPILIAIYAFTTILALASIGDARAAFGSGVVGAARIARHLWRMYLGLTLAFGSGFTNGFARLLPGPYHVPRIFFLPQLVPLCLMIFWLVRVRLPAWRRTGGATETASPG
jgi:uncharacterized membrane protein